MRTFGTSISATNAETHAADYRALGWTVATTANGVALITDDTVCGIEVPAELADTVDCYLQANQLHTPVIALPGQTERRIYLATAPARATRAMGALTAMGATVTADGASIALPPTHLRSGAAKWAVSPRAAGKLQPVVVVAAAVRAAVRANAGTDAAQLAC